MKNDKQALVLGLGESGLAASKLLVREGLHVTAVDAATGPALEERAEALRGLGAETVLGASSLPACAPELVVVSPGIAPDSRWVKELVGRNVPVMGELELGWRHRHSKILAVTGSNGKSTVVKWMVDALRASGLRAEAAGNYGPPLSQVVLEPDVPDWLVVEVSSFQLETVERFRPDVGVLLNCHPNHLDRHGSMDTYRVLKARLFARTGPQDTCVVPADLLETVRHLSGGRGRWTTFGADAGSDYRYRAGAIVCPDFGVLSLGGRVFEGPALGLNATAGLAALAACGVPPELAAETARGLRGLPHRMAFVAERGGVRYVNDSKATNLAGLIAGVRSVAGPVRLIAGGRAKEWDFSPAKEVLAERVAGVYLMGEAAAGLGAAWSGVVPCHACGTLEAAVARASHDAEDGETVLLSPGCTSLDQFESFRERGIQFEALVKHVVEEERSCVGS